jgi:hypothetical protein
MEMISTKKIYLSDVVKARHQQSASEAIRWAKLDAENVQKFQVPQNLHPAIGVLTTAKGVKFYAFINGNYTESTVGQLTALLSPAAK